MGWSDWSKRSAYLTVQADRDCAEKLWKGVQKWDETIGQWMVTGPWDMMIWVDASGWEDLYQKVVWLRSQKGVKATSSHFVYKGMKNGKWWWDWNAGAWVWARGPHLNGELKSMQKWNWATSAASMPGDWDYLVWAGGNKWDDVWSHVGDLSKSGWDTQTWVPIKSWWNKDWEKRWWS